MVATNGCLSNGVEVLSHTFNSSLILSFFRDEQGEEKCVVSVSTRQSVDRRLSL